MCLENEIRALNAKGHNRTEIGQALNLSRFKLTRMCEAMCGLGRPKTIRYAPRKARTKPSQSAQHTLRGVDGTLEELMAHFGVEWTADTVRRRLKEGMTLENAFFTGRPKIRSWYRDAFEQKAATEKS